MQEHKKRIVIIGATSAIAEHCARLWLKERAADLTLVVRDHLKVASIVTDLQVRSPGSRINVHSINFVDPIGIAALADKIAEDGALDIVLIAQGFLPIQHNCQEDLNTCQDALMVNGVSPVLFAEAFAKHMVKNNKGTIAVIGSVAGDRGRKSNYVYGAAKGLIDRYMQGMQHRLAGSHVKIILIKPGPTDTPMTVRYKEQGMRMATVEDVAEVIVNGIAKGKELIYAPAKWALIMLIVRHLPKFIFNKLDI